MESYTENY